MSMWYWRQIRARRSATQWLARIRIRRSLVNEVCNTETTVEDPKLEVNKEVKAITAADGTEKDVTAEAALNDIITYTVTVKNTGNVVLTDVHVADSLEGIKLAEGQSFRVQKTGSRRNTDDYLYVSGTGEGSRINDRQ